MSLGAVKVLRALKLKPVRLNLYPEAAVIENAKALPAAACEVAPEKKDEAPLILACSSKPLVAANELNEEPVETFVTVIPVIGDAEFARDSPVKLNVARVAP
jgi:hypothetical protein